MEGSSNGRVEYNIPVLTSAKGRGTQWEYMTEMWRLT
jgi:hypothetical protein